MKLTKKESAVIRLRYGIEYDEPMTYQEIAEVVKLSKTMVKQLEHRALRKLRHPSYRSALKEIQETIDLLHSPLH